MVERQGGPSHRRMWLVIGAVAVAVAAMGVGSASADRSASPARTGNAGADRPAWSACARGAHPHGTDRLRCARPGDLVDISLAELRPTQSVLGFDEVYYKLGRFRSDKDEQAGDVNKRYDEWCETNGQDEVEAASPGARLSDPTSFTCKVPVGAETPKTIAQMKTIVVGPRGMPYLTDGHHTFTAFWELPDAGPRMHIRVRVTANLSRLRAPAFWREMRRRGFVWLRDENDRPITVRRLPRRLGLAGFRDDKYRGLVYFTRDIGYAKPDEPTEFLEFSWGSWLRRSFDLARYDLTELAAYHDLVRQASLRMAALDDTDVVGGGRTAAELGKLPEWNDGKPESGGEFAKLGVPITDPKPGKLAFALDYRANPH